MSNPNSVVTELLNSFPQGCTQMYFKSSLTALSHAMEDQVLASDEQPLIIASFQKEKFYRQEAHRYGRIGKISPHVYVLAAPETEFSSTTDVYEKVAFTEDDALSHEWHLVVIAKNYANCLICREKTHLPKTSTSETAMDNSRRFEGIWTFDRQISAKAAEILLKRIAGYRPELKKKINQELKLYCQQGKKSSKSLQLDTLDSPMINPDPFVQRLVTYLQAGQYKLIKANRFLSTKEKKERLLNSVTGAIRRSLNPHEILQVAVDKLGEGLGVCRCLIYRCQETDFSATIHHEFLSEKIKSIKGKTWPLKDNPLFQEILQIRESIGIDDVTIDPRIQDQQSQLSQLIHSCSIISWLIVPILYQGKLLGIMELHHCDSIPITWKPEDIALVDAIATQVGVALIQAESYANLENLNEQLEALDRTRSNLVAITGHELRTPLSTIQVCLESLANEPDMSEELRQVMLSTALHDAERMRKLVQDFLTLSQLEGGTVEWNPEPLSLEECIDLSLSHIRSRQDQSGIPTIKNLVVHELPLVQADGEWLVEVLSKLLDNACKFTDGNGTITIQVQEIEGDTDTLEVTISDNGRGIEPDRLDQVFDRFYQEEGALRRSAGGTGLGLAICRQIVKNWGGKIWAESVGKNLGSKFHFTVPKFNNTISTNSQTIKKNRRQSSQDSLK
ncbi:sensory transduction histidine kinase [Geminocystis sp. NIES-3708]|uniref:DICT sensory domain-containing protein n=1 Tax=Geminocystis sp. NIES-3708 TaxID=1615909 RepID=UPI0005FC9C66|nr:DICT sensory domain-containing protein [Geminocystis sp. NIES-3708]BAQ60440.1 sensory transduction histidine kinase [Geminocystis sp. NIES-3708]